MQDFVHENNILQKRRKEIIVMSNYKSFHSPYLGNNQGSRRSFFDCVPETLRPQTSIPIGKLVWRTLSEFPDYEISTFGLVRRCKPGAKNRHHLIGNILQPRLDGVYPEVELFNAKGNFKRKIHILLCQTFSEKKPKIGDIVRHLDHEPQIPTAWTVGWGTIEDNRNDRIYHRSVHALQYPTDQIIKCAALLIDMKLNRVNGKAASKKWGVSYGKIDKLKNRQRHALELYFFHMVLSLFEDSNGKKAGA